MLKAGVAIRNITPKEKVLLCGYPEPKERFGQTAHDLLYGSAYYFENSGVRLMFLCCDIVSMTKDRANELRMLIEKHTGIPRKNIAVSCTHTHSGPETEGNVWENFEEKQELYPDHNDRMRDLLLDAAKEAVSTAFDAKIGYGVGVCGKEQGVGGNRHDPEGPADPSVTVIGIRDLSDNLRGCIVNYSVHPTVLHSYNFLVTADFPAYIRQGLNHAYPFMVFGFNMGSAGNQSTRYFRKGQDFDEAKRIGSAIAAEAQKVLNEMTFSRDAVLKSLSVFAQPPVKKIPSFRDAALTAARAQAEYDRLIEEKAAYPVCRTAECTLIGSNFMKALAASVEKSNLAEIVRGQLPVEVHGIAIGDCLIVGIGCEHFVEIGLRVKEASPFSVTLISSLTNGNTNGYVCTDSAYDTFCYEAQETAFDRGAEGVLTNACMEMMQCIKSSDFCK